jgi:hypothetical protein
LHHDGAGGGVSVGGRAADPVDRSPEPWMPTYRAYLLDTRGKIVWGDWIEADDEQDARRKAQELCSEGKPVVELWEGKRMVGDVECGPK